MDPAAGRDHIPLPLPLVERYTSGERRPTVNMRTLQKKVRRFGQSIRQRTGLSTKVRGGATQMEGGVKGKVNGRVESRGWGE